MGTGAVGSLLGMDAGANPGIAEEEPSCSMSIQTPDRPPTRLLVNITLALNTEPSTRGHARPA
eukprot:3024941-Lingulodinium_polyedra.AAC.1